MLEYTLALCCRNYYLILLTSVERIKWRHGHFNCEVDPSNLEPLATTPKRLKEKEKTWQENVNKRTKQPQFDNQGGNGQEIQDQANPSTSAQTDKGQGDPTLEVSILYNNIPQNEGIKAVQDVLQDEDLPIPLHYILRLLNLVLSNNSFGLNGEHCLQILGTAMGTRLSPGYANIFMGRLYRRDGKRKRNGLTDL